MSKPKPPPVKAGDLRLHPRGYYVRVVKVRQDWGVKVCLYVPEPWQAGSRAVEISVDRVIKYPLQG
jgi:hypothetical protein